ncbi:MAG: hypothetical protein JWN03_3171 [Nocardia sp.]|uniref:HAD domain-containing protein n=1 Tax=Nocardia sp. TaxID=1821 RepID=UPI0026087A74|nr:HAD domain-containing protein [Nocardia sp.]MCU1642896.1 hypothetical protein [Nocardia sp.]
MKVLDRPLLFLDIDGPLIPFGESPGGEFPLQLSPDSAGQGNPLVDRIDPGLGPLLSALSCELVWATTWMHEANRLISPRLGLAALAVVEWSDESGDRVDEWFGLHWKTRALVEWAAGRPFIWIDDEISDRDREWVSANFGSRALLYQVDPRSGLRHSDFATLIDWLDATDS